MWALLQVPGLEAWGQVAAAEMGGRGGKAGAGAGIEHSWLDGGLGSWQAAVLCPHGEDGRRSVAGRGNQV